MIAFSFHPARGPHAGWAAAARGFTAIELLVTVSILGILAAVAMPNFTYLLERWRVAQTADQIRSTLFYARSEAIKRGGNVAIQKLPNGGGCNTASGGADWGCGWTVCADANGNGACDAGEQELQRFDTPRKLEVTRTANGASIALNRWGLVDGAWLGFSIVPQGKSIADPAAKGVCMSAGGRVRVIGYQDLPCNG